MKLSKSQAHYIRAVYELSIGCDGVRVVDIAEKLSLSKASASLAITKLAQQGFMRRDTERHVFLTDEGEREAIRLLDRFQVIRQFLVGILNIKSDIAEHDACALEHVISMDTLCAICRFTAKSTTASPASCSLRCLSRPPTEGA